MLSRQTAKQLLLSNEGFIPHLIDGLLLNPEHPRKDTELGIKAIVQRDFAECILQIALFPPGCEALKIAEICETLEVLVDKAWTDEAKDSARAAVAQLTGNKPGPDININIDIDAMHIMISCKCGGVQLAILEVSNALSYKIDSWAKHVIV
eukprot:COSAG05_NODE_2639_length_2813_cov_1.688651_2_plen_151_part_00